MKTLKLLVRQSLKGQHGAFDVPSIIAGAVVVGILTTGVLATTFGLIPWSQDKAAQQNLIHVRTAQGLATNSEKSFQSMVDLLSKGFINESKEVAVDVDYKDDSTPRGKCYIAVSASKSGKTYFATSKLGEPAELTPASLSAYVAKPGSCLISSATNPLENSTAIKELVLSLGHAL